MNIGFDMDGVLVESSVIFRTLIYNKFHRRDFEKIDDKGNVWFSYEISGISSSRIWDCIYNALLNYQQYMLPVDGMAHAITKLWEMQNKRTIQIISARPEDCIPQTAAWLDAHFPVPYALFVVAPPKNGTGNYDVKNKLVNELGLTHFVEDRLKYASEIARNTDVKKVFLLNKDYNRGRRVASKVERIDWLNQIIKII